jgi:hypothetical protein
LGIAAPGSPAAVVGIAVCSERAILNGKSRDVWKIVVENIP